MTDDEKNALNITGIMGEVNADVQYLSAGANRQTAAGDWNSDGTVAFGADINIALWRPNVRYRTENHNTNCPIKQ